MPSVGTQSPDAYSVLLTARNYAGLQEAFIRVYDILEADGKRNLATLLRKAFLRFREDLLVLARDIAKLAEAAIVEEEQQSRVRPDTNGDGGRRLEDFLGVSVALEAVPGSVGINFEPALYDNVPWWWTNEEGYSGHIGRVVHGLFYEAGFTGASSPDPGASREHPLFRAEGPQRDTNPYGPTHQRTPPIGTTSRGVRPGMRIENPIPRRQFVLHGAQRAEAQWHTGFAAAKAKFDRELDRIMVLFRDTAGAPG